MKYDKAKTKGYVEFENALLSEKISVWDAITQRPEVCVWYSTISGKSVKTVQRYCREFVRKNATLFQKWYVRKRRHEFYQKLSGNA